MRITTFLDDFRESYAGLRVRERIWCYRFKRNYPPLAKAIADYEACSQRKRNVQIRREVKLCGQFWQCYPWHYFLYGLYRADNQMTDEQLLNYVPEFFFYEVFLPHHNSRKLEVLISDKGLIEETFRAVGIPQPRTLCKVIKGRLHTRECLLVEWSDLWAEISGEASSKLVWKPMGGRGGAGVEVFHRSGDGVYQTRKGQALSEELLADLGAQGNWILQVGIEQIAALREIYPHSVNTLRFTTEYLHAKPRAMTAELRMGKGGREVDNASQMGVEVAVNMKTGELRQYAGCNTGECFKKHPDTGFTFHGFRIPEWDKVTHTVETFAARFPRFTYLGWDIALADSGVVAIEVNSGFGIDGQNIFNGLRDALRIEDPGYYWRNRGKR